METYYKPLYKPNQVFYASGKTAIVTGWTLKGTVVKKKLEEHEYGAIEQLYSATRGINFLLRNLLWNPHIRLLIVVNATKEDKNSGAVQCLLDFFRQGFEEGKSEEGVKCWRIKSKIIGYIDPEIPLENLQQLRKSIECHETTSITETVTLAKDLAKLGEKPEWATPTIFPLVENLPTVLPGQRYGHRIEGKTIAETWVKIIHRIKTTGVLRPTGYDGQVQELIDLMAVVTDEPPEFFFPEPNYLPIDRPFLEDYIPQMLEDAPYHEGIKCMVSGCGHGLGVTKLSRSSPNSSTRLMLPAPLSTSGILVVAIYFSDPTIPSTMNTVGVRVSLTSGCASWMGNSH
ncbi:hypothetical protein E5S67_04489 [Microcoleus sp. IPMA8]|uniref:Uncharacterized protein n=1 Tax=Microcoleus asticus IPMA8 TaxID=2563858 RepID=A0ABX2D289_9CYAN|nr:hypothetical protein [Microcoleus asticus IPMA8]